MAQRGDAIPEAGVENIELCRRKTSLKDVERRGGHAVSKMCIEPRACYKAYCEEDGLWTACR